MNVLKNDICDLWMTHVTYDSFICHWSIICDIWMTHVTYASFICHWSMWHITHPSVTYEWHIKNPDIGTVIRVTMSRQLQIIGLFCKRALWKRLYPEKETYIIEEPFKLPTNRHSAGDGMTIWHAMTVCPLDTEWHWMTSSFNVQWTHRDMESNRMTSSFGDGMTMAFDPMFIWHGMMVCRLDSEWHEMTSSVTEWRWHSIRYHLTRKDGGSIRHRMTMWFDSMSLDMECEIRMMHHSDFTWETTHRSICHSIDKNLFANRKGSLKGTFPPLRAPSLP